MQNLANHEDNLFRIFRFFLCIYFVYYFLILIPYSAQLFGHDSQVVDFYQDPIWFFENIFHYFSLTENFINLFLYLAAFISLGICFEPLSRISSLLVWAALMQLSFRNQLHMELQVNFLGVLLLACVIRPKTKMEFLVLNRVLWIIAAFAYAASGWNKLTSEFWQSGDSVYWLWKVRGFFNPLFLRLLSAFPFDLYLPFKIITYCVLALECFYPLFLFSKKLRLAGFVLIVLMHLSILVSSRIIQLSSGMILYHLFMIEPAWISQLKVFFTSLLPAGSGHLPPSQSSSI